MPELLLLFACYNGTGCVQTSNAYFNYNPVAKEVIKSTETKLKNTAMGGILPLIYLSINKESVINLKESINMRIQEHYIGLTYAKEF